MKADKNTAWYVVCVQKTYGNGKLQFYLKYGAQMDSGVEIFFVKFQPTERLYSWARN